MAYFLEVMQRLSPTSPDFFKAYASKAKINLYSMSFAPSISKIIRSLLR